MRLIKKSKCQFMNFQIAFRLGQDFDIRYTTIRKNDKKMKWSLLYKQAITGKELGADSTSCRSAFIYWGRFNFMESTF